MSTGKMPNPPDMPTTKSGPAVPQTQGEVPTEVQAPAVEAPFNLAEDVAGIIEAQADVLAQRLNYHSQLLYGVSALGVDIVNARNSVMLVARGVRNASALTTTYTLVHLGSPQVEQVNDQTLPFKNNNLVAGLLEGLIGDTVARAYGDNAARAHEARLLLNNYFQPANQQMQRISRSLTAGQSQFPALSPGEGM